MLSATLRDVRDKESVLPKTRAVQTLMGSCKSDRAAEAEQVASSTWPQRSRANSPVRRGRSGGGRGGEGARRRQATATDRRRGERANLAGGIFIAEEYRRKTTGEGLPSQRVGEEGEMAPRAWRLRWRRPLAQRRDFSADAARGFGHRPLRQPRSLRERPLFRTPWPEKCSSTKSTNFGRRAECSAASPAASGRATWT